MQKKHAMACNRTLPEMHEQTLYEHGPAGISARNVCLHKEGFAKKKMPWPAIGLKLKHIAVTASVQHAVLCMAIAVQGIEKSTSLMTWP
jgi:hypothetical protein